MKLYSRGQVIFFSLLSGLIMVLFALGFGIVKLPGNKNIRKNADSSEMPVSAAKEEKLQIPEDSAATSHFSGVYEAGSVNTRQLQINVADLAAYTEEERLNITIYEQRRICTPIPALRFIPVLHCACTGLPIYESFGLFWYLLIIISKL